MKKIVVKKKVSTTGNVVDTNPTIVEVDIDSINLWKDNPRKNDDAVAKLMPILKAHGQVTAVVVWRDNMTIYKGNTTYKAMKKLGKKTILVLFVNFPGESAAIAYAIDDNKSSEFAKWDDTVLKGLLSIEDLRDNVHGFSGKDIKSLMLGDALPDKLPAIPGVADNTSVDNYVLICFDDRETYDDFVGKMDGKGTKRTFKWDELKSKMKWR